MIPIIILSIENEDDREFMSRLYLDYRKRMFAGILGYVSDRSAAEDVLHDAAAAHAGRKAARVLCYRDREKRRKRLSAKTDALRPSDGERNG